MLSGCIRVGDVKEYDIEKPKNPLKERISVSRKKKINSYKMLSVTDYTGWFIYVRVALGKNDHEVFTSSPLYLQEGQFFLLMSLLQLMAALKEMVGSSVPTKILVMINKKCFIGLYLLNRLCPTPQPKYKSKGPL